MIIARVITLTPFRASSSLCWDGALFSNNKLMFSDTDRHLINLYPVEAGLIYFLGFGLVGVPSELSASSFLTKPSYLLDLLPLLDDLPDFLLGLSSSYLCCSFLKYQTRKLDTMTLIVKNKMTITVKNDPPSKAVTSSLS